MFRTLKKLIKRLPKSSAILAVSLAIAGMPLSVVYAGYGPTDSSRPTYDWNKYDPTKSCTDPANAFGKCGSVNGPVFDSFVNTPSYGDEEEFNQIAPVVSGQSPIDANFGATAQAQAGQQYWVRVFVHNDSNQNFNCLPVHRDPSTGDCTQIDPGSPGIATGTTVRLAIAQGQANGVDVMAYISANNASPGTVWDSSTLVNNSQAFSVQYVPGSAVIYNGAHQNGLALSDNIDSANGTPLGFDQMDGNLPGCFNYSAYVYVKVAVQAPGLTIHKQVSLNPNGPWQSNVTASKGQTVYWHITYQNSGTDTDNDVTLRDTLPNGVTLVPGSIKWYDANNNGTVQPDNALSGGGVDLGNYAPVSSGINGVLDFNTTVNNSVPSCTLTNVAYGRASNVPESQSSASVTVANCTPPSTPPTTPTALVNTGPGDVVGLFAGTTLLGAAVHKILSHRFLTR